QAFRNMAATVINALSQVAAQMLATLLVKKLLGDGTAGGGGGILSVFGLADGGQVPGHADGGLIQGPGGPKDDRVPAMLSHGEYVVSAGAVKKLGVPYLDAVNRGLQVPTFERLSLPKFAEGGLVGNGGAGGGDSQIHLGIGLDEGLILKHLSSKAAG